MEIGSKSKSKRGERERERERERLCVCKKARNTEPCDSLSFVLKSRPFSLALTCYILVYILSTATSDQPLLIQSPISSHARISCIYIEDSFFSPSSSFFFLFFHFLNPSSRLRLKSLLYNLFVPFLIEPCVDQKNSTIDLTVTIRIFSLMVFSLLKHIYCVVHSAMHINKVFLVCVVHCFS